MRPPGASPIRPSAVAFGAEQLRKSKQSNNGEVGSPSSDDDFRSLFATHPSPMWVYDPISLRFLIVNEAAIELYGYSSTKYLQMTVLDIRPERERKRMIEAVAGRTDMERVKRWQHLKANGEIFEVVTYGRSVRFEGTDAILAVVQDRTELNAAHQQASDTQSLLDSIVENLPVGVFVKDMMDEGRYVLYNEASGEIVGKPSAEIVGKTDKELFTPHQAIHFGEQDQQVMDAGHTLSIEEEIEGCDGDRRLLRTFKRALPAPEGIRPRYLLGISEDVTEPRAIEAKMAHIAMHDALTGLPNRSFFSERIRDLADTATEDAPIALLYFDIDHFKHINDSMGHPAGDALLREVASRLRRLTRSDDLIARLGGDEFAVVLPLFGGIERARAFADRLLFSLAQPIDLDGIQEHISCSIGIAIAPQDGGDSDVLMRNADLALYAAKAAGRSTYRSYEISMRLAATRRHDLTVELRQAIDQEQFELHYQPIISLKDDGLVGFEALIRWRHPQRGLVAPQEFISVAEETGLITVIGDWVLRQACRTAAGWPIHLRIAVNLSVCQFRHQGLLATIVSALDDTGLRADRLEIEITESVFLSDSAQSVPLLHAMKNLGIRIAIDDFGTGYSSLGYLRAFPFDKIKLDRSFVSGIETDPGSLSIVRAVVGIGLGFQATTTAEGIETPEQMQALKAEGFDEAQGYLIGRPMAQQDAEAFIEDRRKRQSAAIADIAVFSEVTSRVA